MILELFLLFLGLALLVKGADFLVTGSSSLAKKFKISSLAIGLTIVAFGTSLPETIVNVYAGIQGNSDIGFGNIIGSNICNILLILGICACIFPLKIEKSTIMQEIPFALLACTNFFIYSNKSLINTSIENYITRADGLVIALPFLVFLYYIYFMIKNNKIKIEDDIRNLSFFKIICLITFGLVLLCAGGKMVVNSTVKIAQIMGISELLISCTIVAIGTSLPELITSVMAIIKKEMNIAVGNIIGSNIFNILFVIPVTCSISPMKVPKNINYDFGFMFFATILLLIFSINKKKEIQMWKGIIFLSTYLLYIGFLIIRG